MHTDSGKPAPLTGNARRAVITASLFAFCYTMWSFLSVYYYPSILNRDRLPKIERLGLFILTGIVFFVFVLLTRRDASAPATLRREAVAFTRQPAFLVLLAWLLWAVVALALAVRENYASLIFNGSFIFDQFINFLILFPLGYFLARRRDDRLLTAIAATCFLLFLPYALGGVFFSISHRSFSLLGRLITLDQTHTNRLRLGGNPNTGGIYGALSFAAGLYLLTKTRRRTLHFLLAVGEAVIFRTLLLTGSRGGIGSAVVALLYFLTVVLFRVLPVRVAVISRKLWTVIGVILALGVLACVGFFMQRFSGRKLVTADPSERFYLWSLLIRVITGNLHFLLHGVSSAGVDYEIGKYYGLVSYSAHNQFFDVWLGQGTPALCLFLIYLVMIARQCLRISFRRDGGEERGDWAASLFVLTLFVNSMVEVILLDSMMIHGGLFFLASGAVCGLASLLPREKKI